MANALSHNTDPNSPVNTSASGGTLSFTAVTGGVATDYAYTSSSATNNANFTGTSFPVSPASGTMAGGINAVTLYSYNLTPAPDGQITSANDLVNGNWTFGYDQFNRLSSSNKNSGLQTFSFAYDRYSNRWQQNAPQGGPAPQYVFDNNNRLVGSGVTYDALGEVLTDGLGNSFTWDDEGRLIQVKQSSTVTATYVYDAEGRRVHGPNGEYVYDLDGRMITQFALNGVWAYGEIYAGSRHLATYSGGTTNFLHGDWQGTKRVMTGLNGAASETCTGFAFGDGVNCTGTNWGFNGFTDDIHDPETNLEHTLFRQYSGTQGRWLTPDPKGMSSTDPSYPQSWNRYAYVKNNAVNATDPTGLDDCFYFGCGFDFGSYFASLNSFLNALIEWELAQLGTVAFGGETPMGNLNGILPGEWQARYPSLSDTIHDLLSGLPWNNPCIMSPVSDGCGLTGFTSNIPGNTATVPVVTVVALGEDPPWNWWYKHYKAYAKCRKEWDECLQKTFDKVKEEEERQRKCEADGGSAAECACGQVFSQGACMLGKSKFGDNCKDAFKDCMLAPLQEGHFPKKE